MTNELRLAQYAPCTETSPSRPVIVLLAKPRHPRDIALMAQMYKIEGRPTRYSVTSLGAYPLGAKLGNFKFTLVVWAQQRLTLGSGTRAGVMRLRPGAVCYRSYCFGYCADVRNSDAYSSRGGHQSISAWPCRRGIEYSDRGVMYAFATTSWARLIFIYVLLREKM